jgi:hypothetical protein
MFRLWKSLLLSLLVQAMPALASTDADTLQHNVQQPETNRSSDVGVLSVQPEPTGVESFTVFCVRTNLLLPLMNIGFEVPLGNRWSVGADWYYPWIPRYSNKAFNGSSHKNCYQVDGLSIEGRYWLGSKHKNDAENKRYRLTGHSIGLFTMTGRYDWEHNYRGYQGEYILGGVDYLYAKPIFKGRAYLEFALGIGYFYSKATHYQVYERAGRGHRDKDSRKIFQYFGPLKANVSLVVPIRKTKTKATDR